MKWYFHGNVVFVGDGRGRWKMSKPQKVSEVEGGWGENEARSWLPTGLKGALWAGPVSEMVPGLPFMSSPHLASSQGCKKTGQRPRGASLLSGFLWQVYRAFQDFLYSHYCCWDTFTLGRPGDFILLWYSDGIQSNTCTCIFCDRLFDLSETAKIPVGLIINRFSKRYNNSLGSSRCQCSFPCVLGPRL